MKKFIVCLITVLVPIGAMAETKPFNLSLTPGVAIYDQYTVIEGVTFSLFGENEQKSLAFGGINGTTGQSSGLAGAMLLNYADDYTGVRGAMINTTKADAKGWDAGIVNYTKGLMNGLATGIVNYSSRMQGLGLGLVNYTDDADGGVQLGLVNIIRSNQGWFSDFPNQVAPVMMFANWRLSDAGTQ
jgi:hypothetical protein